MTIYLNKGILKISPEILIFLIMTIINKPLSEYGALC